MTEIMPIQSPDLRLLQFGEVNQFNGIQAIIDTYVARTVSAVESPTLMEIAGFPHWENVYSNILSFFLNSHEAHGFGNLFFRAIVSAYHENCPPDDGYHHGLTKNFNGQTVTVEREVVTNKGLKIDLLVTSQLLNVCIENKVWSSLHNDLENYRSHCESLGNKVIGIVLSPDGIFDKKITDNKFVSISYGSLANHLQLIVGQYLDPANIQYHYLLMDFIKQLKRFKRGTSMNNDDREFINFWKRNSGKINNINKMQERLFDVLCFTAKAKADGLISNSIEAVEEKYRKLFKSFIWNGKDEKPYPVFELVAVYEVNDPNISTDNKNVFLDVVFHPLRIEFRIGKRQGCPSDDLISKINEKSGSEFQKRGNDFYLPPLSSLLDPPSNPPIEIQVLEQTVKILKAFGAVSLELNPNFIK